MTSFSMSKSLLVVSVAAAALLSGCSTVNTIERASPQGRPAYVPDRRVVTDIDLADSLHVFGILQTYVSGDLLKIEMRVQNTHHHAKTYRYRIEWFGKDGMALPSPTDAWKLVTLEGQETASLAAIATTPRAVDFVIKFQHSSQ